MKPSASALQRLMLAAQGLAPGLSLLFLLLSPKPQAHSEDPPLDRVLAGLESPSPKIRAESIGALRNLGLPSLGWHVLPRLVDPDPGVRDRAVEALIGFQNPNPPLAALAYQSPSGDLLRREALRVLGRIPREETVTALLQRLSFEQSQAAKLDYARALCQLHDHKAPPQATAQRTGSQSSRIAQALTLILQSLEGESAAALCAELAAHHIRLQGSLEKTALLSKNHPALVEALIRACSNEPNPPKEAVSELILFLKNEEKTEPQNQKNELRLLAAKALLQANLHSESVAAVEALSALFASLPSPLRQTPEAQRLIANFLKAPGLHALLPSARSQAETLKPPLSGWSEILLVTLASRPASEPNSAESRRLAIESIQTGWKTSPQRRRQILEALLQTGKNIPAMEVAIAEIAEDGDEPTRQLAAKVVTRLQLNPDRLLGLDQPGPALKSLSFEDALRLASEGRGRRADGQRLFEKQGCSDCHTLTENLPRKGPFLGHIGAERSRRELIEALLDPNRAVAREFQTHVFRTTDGRELSGLPIRESSEEITLLESSGRTTSLPAASVESRQPAPKSIMPRDRIDALSLRDFRSLLDYLQSLGSSQPHATRPN